MKEKLHLQSFIQTKVFFLNKIHPFYDGNSKACKILFADDDTIM